VAAVLRDGQAESRCARCFRAPESPKRCGRCRTLVYCSPACQRDDWDDHRDECAVLSRMQSGRRQPVEEVRLACRVVRQLQQRPALVWRGLPPGENQVHS